MIDYKKVASYIHDYADEMNMEDKINPEVRLSLLIGYIYGIMECAYLVERTEYETNKE